MILGYGKQKTTNSVTLITGLKLARSSDAGAYSKFGSGSYPIWLLKNHFTQIGRAGPSFCPPRTPTNRGCPALRALCEGRVPDC